MKKNPGRRERRMFTFSNRRLYGKKSMKLRNHYEKILARKARKAKKAS